MEVIPIIISPAHIYDNVRQSFWSNGAIPETATSYTLTSRLCICTLPVKNFSAGWDIMCMEFSLLFLRFNLSPGNFSKTAKAFNSKDFKSFPERSSRTTP